MSLFSLFATTVLAVQAIFVVVISGSPTSGKGALPASVTSYVSSDIDGINSRQSLESLHFRRAFPSGLSPSKRFKRTAETHITDCIYITLDEGEFYHKATTEVGKVCGAYISSEPDQKIEILFNYLDVPCENGGLVSVVDGWELNGEYFPSPEDHHKPITSRYDEFCGQRKIKQRFISSQNAALIQYRMPARGTSFSFSVRFIKNLNPCNVLLQSEGGTLTVKNYGKRSNCSISTLFPAAVSVLSLNVGVVPSNGRGIELETGTIHKCQKRGLDDYVQVGGSDGLDNSNMVLADSMCGLDSKAGKWVDLIACGTTTVRLVSSGAFDNSVTVNIRGWTEEDANGHMSAICPTDM